LAYPPARRDRSDRTLVIRKHLVGFVDLFETFFSVRRVTDIGVILAGKLPESAFDVIF